MKKARSKVQMSSASVHSKMSMTAITMVLYAMHAITMQSLGSWSYMLCMQSLCMTLYAMHDPICYACNHYGLVCYAFNHVLIWNQIYAPAIYLVSDLVILVYLHALL